MNLSMNNKVNNSFKEKDRACQGEGSGPGRQGLVNIISHDRSKANPDS